MSELSLRQTDTIARFVKNHSIVFSHLGDDLIDHLCCDIEDKMRAGSDFEEAFTSVKGIIGTRGLEDIQETTLYAVDSKYRKMKKLMKITGVAGTVMLGFAALFKILHLAGASVLLLLGALILVTLFLPSSLGVLWKESKSSKRLFLFIAAFISSTLFIIGVIFKIQHWPGSGITLTIGVLSGVFLLLPAVIYDRLKDSERTVPKWIYYATLILGIAYGLGFLFKLMHWPGASTLLSVGMLFLFGFVAIIYIYHRYKGLEYVSSEAIFIFVAIIMFVVPSSLLSIRGEGNFEGGFLETTGLNHRSINFRTERNERLFSSLDASQKEIVLHLHEQTEAIIDKISEINDQLSPAGPLYFAEESIPAGYGDLEPFNHEAVAALMADDNPALNDLNGLLTTFIDMLASLNNNEFDAAVAAKLDLHQYIPVASDEPMKLPSPVVMFQSMDILRGAVLDAEASTIRNILKMETSTNNQ